MKNKSAEADKIVELYGREPDYTFPYEGLPEAGNFIPLQKYPVNTALTEKIGNTEYTVNAHFREDGGDLLCLLSQLILHGVDPNIYRE